MAKITTVTKARTDQGKCGRCGDLVSKGSAYRHASPGFRAAKVVRCTKPGCYFRQSELTTSKMSAVYAAHEGADEALDALREQKEPVTEEDFQAIASDYAEEVRQVAGEYEEAADAMGEAGYEMQEKADELESHADEVEGFEPETTEVDCPLCEALDEPNPKCEKCEGEGFIQDLDVDSVASALSEAMGELSL